MNSYKKELETKGVLAFVPSGNSMWPTLKDRGQTVILIKKTERLNKLDVGFFTRPNGQYVLHRVVNVLENGYVFQGDGQDFTEEIKEENVLAYMEGFYRGKKYVSATSPAYIKEVEKLLSSDEKRLKKVNRHLKLLAVKNKILKLFGKKVKKVIE